MGMAAGLQAACLMQGVNIWKTAAPRCTEPLIVECQDPGTGPTHLHPA